MKRLFALLFLMVAVANCKTVQDVFVHPKTSVTYPNIVTDPVCLLRAAKDTLHYLESKRAHMPVISPETFRPLLSLERVKQTLKFVIDTIQADQKTGASRITNSAWLKKHFDVLDWKADWQTAQIHNIPLPHDGRIRLTSYAVLTVQGSPRKTADYPCGIYQLFDRTLRKKYTKQQVLAGVLEQGANRSKRKALAWVSRQSLEDALMHGTVLIKLPDETCKICNVDVDNGIGYVKSQKNVLQQKRYWFFKELTSKSKSPWRTVDRIKQRQSVVFAGDVRHIGMGKLIGITYKNPVNQKSEMRLGVLADTGGAFKDNLYQLDLFSGIVKSHTQLRNHIKRLPSYVHAMILYKR